ASLRSRSVISRSGMSPVFIAMPPRVQDPAPYVAGAAYSRQPLVATRLPLFQVARRLVNAPFQNLAGPPPFARAEGACVERGALPGGTWRAAVPLKSPLGASARRGVPEASRARLDWARAAILPGTRYCPGGGVPPPQSSPVSRGAGLPVEVM